MMVVVMVVEALAVVIEQVKLVVAKIMVSVEVVLDTTLLDVC